VTKKFTFVWNDPSQSSQTINLTVYKQGNLNDTIVCSVSSTSYTGVLVCDISAYTGTFKAIAYRTASPNTPLASLYAEIKQTFIDAGGGKLGLFIGAILLIFFALVGIASPILVILLSVISLIPLVLLGSLQLSAFIAIGLMAGIILHFSRRIQ